MLLCQNPLCRKEFNLKPGSLGKYCSLSCGTTHRNNVNKEKDLEGYKLSPVLCFNCKCTLDYIKRKNRFCSKSCASIYNNSIRDKAKIKTGPKKGYINPNFIPYTKILQCVICGAWHKGKAATCSKVCFSKYVSLKVRGKTGGNRDINLPGTDSFGKKFYFDSTWEILLANSLDENKIVWERPEKFILSDGRSYSPDFYIPEYNVYLDPKAKRPNYYRYSILKIEMFEKEFNAKCLVISDKKLLTWGHIQTMVLVENFRS